MENKVLIKLFTSTRGFEAWTGRTLLSAKSLIRYLVAAKDLKAGEIILTDKPFVLGPSSDTSLVCFNCYLPLLSKFLVCKYCALAPICPGDGCPLQISSWHSKPECEYFRNLKLTKDVSPMTMVQNVSHLLVLRTLLRGYEDKTAWNEFMRLESHLNERKDTSIWNFCENAVKTINEKANKNESQLSFIKSLGVLECVKDKDIVQKICAIIDVNSFEVRGPVVPIVVAMGCSELLRGVYLQAALLAHDCVSNTHMAIDNNNILVCRASIDIKKGQPIFNRYTDVLKGTIERQRHLIIGKYFTCTCVRCQDLTEMGTFLNSALCRGCKTGYISCNVNGVWTCQSCESIFQQSDIGSKVQMCSEKLAVINKKDEKELEQYIKNVSLVLAPNHYLLLEAKQRLAGVLRDALNREPRPTKRMMRRKIELCKEILPVLEKLSPGLCRIKAVTLYELHATMVQLAKKLFDGREITGSVYLNELQKAEKHLKKSLETLFIEPKNSPEGELCTKALEEYRALKITISGLLISLNTDEKKFDKPLEKH